MTQHDSKGRVMTQTEVIIAYLKQEYPLEIRESQYAELAAYILEQRNEEYFNAAKAMGKKL